MTVIDSSIAGYILPTTTTPVFDEAFEDFLHDVFAGVTGIDGKLVRPRFQPEPPNFPAFGTDWLAFGVTGEVPDTFGYEEHRPDGEGYDLTQRHEIVNVLLSFYGPNASANRSFLTDGLQIEQNRAALMAASVGVVACGGPMRAPVLQKERWLNRVDMTVTLRREIRRTYPILSFVSAGGMITSGALLTQFDAG
jgi:hypothetical protein